MGMYVFEAGMSSLSLISDKVKPFCEHEEYQVPTTVSDRTFGYRYDLVDIIFIFTINPSSKETLKFHLTGPPIRRRKCGFLPSLLPGRQTPGWLKIIPRRMSQNTSCKFLFMNWYNLNTQNYLR
jgi:hypothetical protein